MERLVREGDERAASRALLTDPAPSADLAARRDARASGLRYVSVDTPGIQRRRAGRGFVYIGTSGRTLRGAATLARIKAIAIPACGNPVACRPLAPTLRPCDAIARSPAAIDTGAQGRTLDRLAVGTLARGSQVVMAPSLLELMEELLQSIEQRDAGDPDAPAWEASGRVRRLEEELARRLSEAVAERGTVAVASVEARQPEGALAGIA